VKVHFVVALLGCYVHAQQITPVQAPDGMRVNAALYADINGDKRPDLIISTTGTRRAIRIHLQRAKGAPFIGKPDYELAPVYSDVVTFAVGDVHPDPGAEIVLFSANQIYAWRPNGPEKERAVKLAECDFLWQLPWRSAWPWPNALVDIDGDGMVDIVIPEPEGYRILRQTKLGTFGEPALLVVPAGPEVVNAGELSSRSRRTRMVQKYSTRVSIGGGGEMIARFSGPLVDISDHVPAPQMIDWDADGDLDLVVRTTKRLYVWIHDGKGGFGKRPAVDLLMPVVADRKRKLEVSYSAHTVDLDRDRRADCVIFSGDQRSSDIRTQVQFFTQRRGKTLFGEKGLPDQLLVLAGFAGLPRFDDIDGDGYPDLFASAVRPDLLDSIKGGSSKHLDAEVYVFLSRKGTFARKPDLLYRTKIQVEGMKPSGDAAIMRFFGDATGNGMRDLLLRDSSTRLKVLMTRRTGDTIKVFDRPVYEIPLAEDARVRIGPERKDARGRRKAPDLIIVEKTQVLHVRFK